MRALWIIPAVYFVFVAAEFALMTHMALQATADGRSTFVVGLLATALWAGILLASTQAHAAVRRHGHARVLVTATAIATLAAATTTPHEALAGWLGAAFVLGLCGGCGWVAGEAWIVEASPSAQRGLFIGLFETAVGLGLMAGPALVPLTRSLGLDTPTSGTVLMLVACLASLALLGAEPPGSGEQREGCGRAPDAWRTMALAPLAIAMLSGLMESGVSALLPSIAMRLGTSLESAAWLGACIGAGSALIQPPAGHLADRFGVRRITLLAWLMVLLANTLLLWAADDPAPVLWVVGFTLGGVGGAVYTLMIVELGHRLAGAALVRAIGLLVTAYSIGTAAGPMIGGALFDVGGFASLATALLTLSAIALGVTYLTLADSQRAPSTPST